MGKFFYHPNCLYLREYLYLWKHFNYKNYTDYEEATIGIVSVNRIVHLL